MRYLSSLLILPFLLIACQGQQSKTATVVPSVELDDQIWTVFQDSKGHYWFGSNGQGVYLWNGKDLQQITTAHGLINNSIRGIQEDHQGRIFVETQAGISQYNGFIWTTLEPIAASVDAWKLEPNDLWFNCLGSLNHVYRFDGQNLYELPLPKQDLATTLGIQEDQERYSPYAVYGIDKDKTGNLWLGTATAGAFRYDGQRFLWIGEKELSTLPDGRVPGVRSMLQDQEGYFWLSHFKRQYKMDSTAPKGYTTHQRVDLPPHLVQDKILYFNAGLVDQQGNLWMTTYGGGVWKYDGNQLSNQEIHNGTTTVLLTSIYQDKQGTIWLGTNNDGCYRQEGATFKKFAP